MEEIDKLFIPCCQNAYTLGCEAGENYIRPRLDIAIEALEKWKISYEAGRAPYDVFENPAENALNKIRALMNAKEKKI